MAYLYPGITVYPSPTLYPLGYFDNDICKIHVFLTHDLAIWTEAVETNDVVIVTSIAKEVAIVTNVSVASDLTMILTESNTGLVIKLEVFNSEF